jgi:hypothetical protein
MKNIYPSLLALTLTLFFCPAKAQTDKSPSAYLEAINAEFGKMSKDMMSYISAVNHGKSARKVEKRRTELVLQTKESERTIRTMKPFEGNSQLRDSVTNYLRICNIVTNQDYEKIVNMEEIAEQSYDAMEAYLLAKEKAGEKIELAYDAAEREYYAFAASNNIRIIENESKLSARLKAAARVNDYHDKVYLLFFKSYKNDAYLLEAMNTGNVGALEQTRNALKASATEDLARLGAMEGFDGDVLLKRATQNILTYYKEEAEKVSEIIDFFLAKENFEKQKKAFDSKKASQRTQADIDNYNKSIEDFNAKVNRSNKVNDELNKKRSAALKDWNTASQNFLDKHTPK